MVSDNSQRTPTFWQLQALGWTSFCLVGILGSIPDLLRHRASLINHFVACFFMFLGSCVLHPICRSLLNRAPPLLALELRTIGWSAVIGGLSALVNELVLHGREGLEWPRLLGSSTQFGFVFILWSSLYFSIRQNQQSASARERLLRAETEVREARLLALQYQLNPHFLFNSLNAVSTLVLDGEASSATKMLAQIGDLLRSSLENEGTIEVPLSQEIALTKQYLAIEQTRLGERLQVDFEIDPNTLDGLVPNKLLQPLVENAVLHGVMPLVGGGRVLVKSTHFQGRLQITVSNSGMRPSEVKMERENGIGLKNTRDRLYTLYRAEQSFSLEWPDWGGCEVTVIIPFHKDEETCAS